MWKLNKKEISSGGDYQILSGSNTTTLSVSKLTLQHGGSYSVLAHNDVGEHSVSYTIKVLTHYLHIVYKKLICWVNTFISSVNMIIDVFML